MHLDLVAHLVGLLTLCGASLRSSLAEIPTDLVVGHRRAVLFGELHEGVEVLQIVLACHVVDSGHDGGADRLILDGVENGLKRGVKRINAVGRINAGHLAVLLHPGVHGSIHALAIGNSPHLASLGIRQAINHAVNLSAGVHQLLAHNLHWSGLRGGGHIARARDAIVIEQFGKIPVLVIAGRNRFEPVPLIVIMVLNIEGGQTIGEKHRKTVFHIILLVQQVGGQLEAGLRIGTAIRLQTCDSLLRSTQTIRVRHIHPVLIIDLMRISKGRKGHDGNIAGSSCSLSICILCEAVQERICGLLGGSQTGHKIMRRFRHPLSIVCSLPALPA